MAGGTLTGSESAPTVVMLGVEVAAETLPALVFILVVEEEVAEMRRYAKDTCSPLIRLLPP